MSRLTQEHDMAIRAFERAIQLNPRFEYAYTLLGHEYLSNEDLDRSLTSFQKSIRINPRHYNALYGIGLVYSKQEKFNFAEFHYRKALEINPSNPVLLSFTASLIQKDRSRLQEALLIFTKAEEIAPKHPPYQFHKAQVLCAMERYEVKKNSIQ